MLTEQEKNAIIERRQIDAKADLKILKRDFYDDLPRQLIECLDKIYWRWQRYDWFEEAWNKYRDYVLECSSTNKVPKAPGFIFNDYIDDQVRSDFLNEEENYYVHSDQDLDELFHHGVKGQKWGIRRYVNENGKMTAQGKRHAEHDITVGAGAAAAGTLGGILAYKRFVKKAAKGTNLKTAIAKTALVGLGSAIVGGLLGHTINKMKQTYESNQNKPRSEQVRQDKAERMVGKKASDVSGLFTGKNRIGISANPLHPGVPVIKRRK